MKIALICSTGGHLLEMMNLKSAWQKHDRFFVTFPLEDARTLLEGERVLWAYHPTNRSVKNLVRNWFLAWRIMLRERPDAVVSTGAGIAVPFIFVAQILRIRTAYLECITRIHSVSISGRIVLPVVGRFFGQWEELTKRHKRIHFNGRNL